MIRQLGVRAMRLLHASHGDRAGAVKISVVLHPRPGEDVGSGTIARRWMLLGARMP
jgi:hypothetical protein